jgi:hypothetical protein
MSDEVKRITIQLRTPRGNDPGKVAQAWFCTNDNFVVLCDESGKPAGDRHILASGEDARLAACRLLRRRSNASASRSGFDGRPIAYPRLGKI